MTQTQKDRLDLIISYAKSMLRLYRHDRMKYTDLFESVEALVKKAEMILDGAV